MDWKDALASLSGLPEGDEQPIVSDQPSLAASQEATKGGLLHIVMEKKGRGGKTATIIEGFQCPDSEIAEIARLLRRRLGTGGSARGGEILIQGDRRSDVAVILRQLGFKVK